jgi:cytochrome c556
MKLINRAIAGAAVIATLSGIALAHDGATGMVMQRMEAMKEIGSSMKAIGAMVKGEREFDGAAVESAAGVIAGHAKHMPHMFPEGSLDKPTEALPVIWVRWDNFTGIAKTMEADAMALAKAAKVASSAQDILPQLAEVGKSCKSCHQDFRQAK